MKCDELESYVCGGWFCSEESYHKNDVDEAVAELKQKINEAETELELWRDGSIISEVHQKELDELRHQKYRRCLEIAGYYDKKAELYCKWHKRWLELAEKFKETK